MAVKTINLTGAEVAVTGLDGAHAHITNMGADIIYAAKSAGISPGADGVVPIPAGNGNTLRGISGAVYLSGTGSVLIQSDDYVQPPSFRNSTASGGSGVDDIARAAINEHAGNVEIHVTAAEKAAWDGKAELTDIPTALPADGGNADTAKTLSSWAGNAVLDLNNAPLGFSRAPGHAENNPFDFWVTSLLLGGYSDKYKQQYVFPWGNSNSKQMPKYRVYDNGAWCDWQSCQTSITNKSTAQSLINCLDIADAVPHDEDYFIVQYAGGGTERTDFYRKPTSKLYDYIRNKLMSSCSFRGKDTGFIYAFLNGSSSVSLNDIKYESHRFAFNVTDYPSEAGISYGFLDVDYFDGTSFTPVQNGIVRQTWTKYNDPSKTWTRLYISSSETEGTWTDWVRTSNDRNADTVDGKHASDFVLKTDYDALAARVAALEGGTT